MGVQEQLVVLGLLCQLACEALQVGLFAAERGECVASGGPLRYEPGVQLQLGAGRFGAPHGLLVLGGEVGKELGHLVAIGLQQRLGNGAVGGGAPGFELLGHEDVVLSGGLELAQPMASDIVRALVVLLHEGACLAVEVIGVVSQPLFEVRVSAGLGKAGNKLVGFGGSIRTP